jgi:Ca-activated chloride channel family protein
VVVTDGYIAGERSVFDLINENVGSTNFFAFGIGSSVNRYLIEGVARAGLGEPFIVTKEQEAAPAGDRFRNYIQSPVLTSVRVQYDGFDAYDVEPETQPDLFAERPVVVIGKWRGARRGRIEVTGRTPSGGFVRTFDVAQSATRPEHAPLPQLWARTRIGRLSDFSFGQEDPETAAEVTALGLAYSLLTRHTSFIAVLEEVRNTTGQGADVDQPLPLPNGVSELAIGGQYGVGAEPGFWVLLAGVGLLLALLARRRSISC